MITTAQTLRVRVVLDRLDEFQRAIGSGTATNIDGGKSNYGERAQIVVLSPGVLEVSGKSQKVGAKRWKVTLHLGVCDVVRGDDVAYAVDTSGGSALVVRRGEDVRVALGDVVDLGVVATPDHISVTAAGAHAVARKDLVATPEELAYWLGHYVGARVTELG